LDSLVSAFEKLNQNIRAQQSAGAMSMASVDRQQSFENFQKLGLPTRKLESWKYTSLKSFSEKVFNPIVWNNKIIKSADLNLEQKNQIIAAAGEDFDHLVFVNGGFVEDLSVSLGGLAQQGLVVQGLSGNNQFSGDIGDKKRPVLDQQFSNEQDEDHSTDAMFFLQKAFSGFELNLKLKKSSTLLRPLQVINLLDVTTGPAQMMQPVLKIHLEENSQMTLLQTWTGSEASTYFIQPRIEIELDKNSSLNWIDQQKIGRRAYFVGHQSVLLNEASNLKALSYQSGGLLSRQQLKVKICGHHSTSQFLGLNVLGYNQHSDQNTKIQFIDGQSTCEQLYKSILAGESRSVFSGMIKINPKAQKSYSTQLNKNLLLSDKAQCDSEPQLEIEADDVKANHGSTVGQLSAEEVFYLQSRGLSKEKSMEMLSFGFAADVVERFENTILRSYLTKSLKSEFEKMNSELPKAKSL